MPAMELDHAKIDDAVLALLQLGLHDGCRAWKGFDWDSLGRLHEQGYISDPVGEVGRIYRGRFGAVEQAAGGAVWKAVSYQIGIATWLPNIYQIPVRRR